MYVGVEFAAKDGSEEGDIALVHKQWLTPLKQNVYWPPLKGPRLKKALKFGEDPDPADWQLYRIKRIFFEYDDIGKASKYLKKCEYTSDVQSAVSDVEKRQIKQNKKYIITSSSSSEEEELSEPERGVSQPQCVLSEHQRVLSQPRRVLSQPHVLKSKFENKCSKKLETIIIRRPPRFIDSPSRRNNSAIGDYDLRSPDSNLYEESLGHCSNSEPRINFASTPEHRQQNILPATPASRSTISLEQVFTELKKLKEQVKEVLAIVKQKNPVGITSLPDDLPVRFPLNRKLEVDRLEEYFNDTDAQNNLASFLSTLGGNGPTALTNKILKYVISNELAIQYNFFGQRQTKRPFSNLKLKSVIIRAVQINLPSTTQLEVENSIKVWLKHAKQRMVNDRNKHQ